MTEQNQGQNSGSAGANEGGQGSQSNSGVSDSNNTSNESSSQSVSSGSEDTRVVSKNRFDDVNRRMKEAEETVARYEQEREQAQEAKDQEKGEFQKIADKWKTKAEKLENELKQVKNDWTRERRINVWNNAAQGIVRSEAIMDAFSFLSDTELDSIDDTDPEAYKPLAQTLVEAKPYLSADGPRGAGSGGSRTPVQTFTNGSVTRDRSSIFQNKNKRKQWK